MNNKQLELFSVDDMYGCIGVEDEVEAIYVVPYLWAIRVVSSLDDEMFYKVIEECKAVKIGEGDYSIPSIPGSMDIFKFQALRECLNMRVYATIGDNFIHHYPEASCRPHISDRYSFDMAKKAFQEYFNKEFQQKGWWITD